MTNKKQIKILYMHGFESTGNSRTVKSLREILGDNAIILAPHFSYDLSAVDCINQTINEAKTHADEFCPDVIIGSSFGGFIASFMSAYQRILINPCLLPSERLHILSPNLNAKEIEKLKALENSIDKDVNNKVEVYGLFGLHDELFSYLSLFENRYGKQKAYTMPCGHRIDPENIKNHLMPIIEEVQASLCENNGSAQLFE